MPPIIMNDCGSGGVSSGSPGDNTEEGGYWHVRYTKNKLPLLALSF